MKLVTINTIKDFLIEKYGDAVFFRSEENKAFFEVGVMEVKTIIEIDSDREAHIILEDIGANIYKADAMELTSRIIQAETEEERSYKKERLQNLSISKESVLMAYPAIIEELEKNKWNLLNTRMLTFHPDDWYLIVALCQNIDTGEYSVNLFNAERGFFSEGYYTREYFSALKKWEEKQ